MNSDAGTCPFDGTPLTLPTLEERELDGGMVHAVVVTDPGNVSRHLRDEHPAMWARMCEQQRRMNANPFIGGMPRKVDGTFLRPGEDVGDTP